MKTKVCLSVDLEASIAGALTFPDRFQPLLHEVVAGNVNGRSQGIGSILRITGETGLKATFFTETLHVDYFGADAMAPYVETIMREGHDVQLHLHPCWTTFGREPLDFKNRTTDQCNQLPVELLAQLIRRGAAQIKAWTGYYPEALRTGNFSSSRSVFQAASDAGIRVTSNICSAVSPPLEPEIGFLGGRHIIEDVVEYPATCFLDLAPGRNGGLRPLQINACSSSELITILEQAHEFGYRYLILVAHAFEFIKGDSFRYERIKANRTNQARLRTLCRFLAENSAWFEPVTFADLVKEVYDAHEGLPRPLRGSRPQAFLRAIENVANNFYFY